MRGRNFSAQDSQASTPVVLVNQSFARYFFPNQDPIGKHFGLVSPKNSRAFEIAGVFADFKMGDPRREVTPLFLRPLSPSSTLATPTLKRSHLKRVPCLSASIIIQFANSQQNAEATMRQALAEIDPNLTIFYFSSYESQVAEIFNQDRLIARLTSFFAGLALTLASVGLYGVVSFFVARPTSEIGIRMAMGATRASVVSMVLGGVLRQIVIGIVLGDSGGHLRVATLREACFIRSALSDPLAYLAAVMALGICAAVAGFIPARRAASIDPMDALRE